MDEVGGIESLHEGDLLLKIATHSGLLGELLLVSALDGVELGIK